MLNSSKHVDPKSQWRYAHVLRRVSREQQLVGKFACFMCAFVELFVWCSRRQRPLCARSLLRSRAVVRTMRNVSSSSQLCELYPCATHLLPHYLHSWLIKLILSVRWQFFRCLRKLDVMAGVLDGIGSDDFNLQAFRELSAGPASLVSLANGILRLRYCSFPQLPNGFPTESWVVMMLSRLSLPGSSLTQLVLGGITPSLTGSLRVDVSIVRLLSRTLWAGGQPCAEG